MVRNERSFGINFLVDVQGGLNDKHPPVVLSNQCCTLTVLTGGFTCLISDVYLGSRNSEMCLKVREGDNFIGLSHVGVNMQILSPLAGQELWSCFIEHNTVCCMALARGFGIRFPQF